MGAKSRKTNVDTAVADRLRTYPWLKVTPGGVVGLWSSQANFVMPFGNLFDGGPAVTAETIYDLASVTKPIAGFLSIASLVSAGKLRLEDAVDDYLDHPNLSGIEVKHLLGHCSGFPAHIEFFKRDVPSTNRKRWLLSQVLDTPRTYPTGSRVEYSDLGYILLGHLIEKVSGMSLDAYVQHATTESLALSTLRFPGLNQLAGNVAPTEPLGGGKFRTGVVHDDNCRAGGGVFAHAGLFATIEDVLKIGRAVVSLYQGQPVSSFAPAVIKEMIETSAAAGSWRLGWDTPTGEVGASNAGDKFRGNVIGHLGFTGTSIWLDLDAGAVAVILTNRVQRSWDKLPIRGLRRAIMDVLAAFR